MMKLYTCASENDYYRHDLDMCRGSTRPVKMRRWCKRQLARERRVNGRALIRREINELLESQG